MSHSVPITNRGFLDLNPVELGWQKCVPGHSFGPSIRNHYLIHYVLSGKGVLHNEAGTHLVKAGEIFLIRPGQKTLYTADLQDPWNYIWVGFTGRLASQLELLNASVLPCKGDVFLRLQRAADLSSTREEFVAGQIFTLFSQLLEAEQPSPGYEQQAADYIRANYMKEFRIESLADMLGLNRRYLGRRFKAAFGLTPQEFLIQTRLENALRYLQQGKSVAEAALLSGYSDVFHFSKMFKSRYGLSPQNYRKTLRP